MEHEAEEGSTSAVVIDKLDCSEEQPLNESSASRAETLQ
jgi:hypothetical protein